MKADSKYIPDLPAFIQVCEHNYARLNQLLGNKMALGHTQTVLIEQVSYRIEVISAAKYTVDVHIEQTSHCLSEHGIGPLSLLVRVYHDAKVAEVLSKCYHSRLLPTQGYPNPNMHHKDEKYQANALLHDFLAVCLKRGRAFFAWGASS